jgi:dUTP pyrophosphatase
MKVRMGFKKLSEEARTPTYGSVGAACMDLYTIEDYVLHPGNVRLLRTGIALDIPSGYEVQIRPRGSAIKTRVIILNSPGTVDEDYRGEIFVGVKNLSDIDVVIKKGDRVAQMILKEVIKMDLFEVDELSETLRGDGCLGSTGR